MLVQGVVTTTVLWWTLNSAKDASLVFSVQSATHVIYSNTMTATVAPSALEQKYKLVKLNNHSSANNVLSMVYLVRAARQDETVFLR